MHADDLRRVFHRSGHRINSIRKGWIEARDKAKLPDKITIFQKPIEGMGGSDDEIIRLIQEVVYHEVAHYFGIGDRRLRELGY